MQELLLKGLDDFLIQDVVRGDEVLESLLPATRYRVWPALAKSIRDASASGVKPDLKSMVAKPSDFVEHDNGYDRENNDQQPESREKAADAESSCHGCIQSG